jgi:hypothetical protein
VSSVVAPGGLVHPRSGSLIRTTCRRVLLVEPCRYPCLVRVTASGFLFILGRERRLLKDYLQWFGLFLLGKTLYAQPGDAVLCGRTCSSVWCALSVFDCVFTRYYSNYKIVLCIEGKNKEKVVFCSLTSNPAPYITFYL